ncbi:class I SAM-dependent methyltransferase [Paenibacillus sophorae]|uniref:Class I SAM-dependent methyltransferase n=1 Tax=Paenibacillus sophorae TaxID=1333845 RepID=A0ABX8HGM5_9BACL|nr:class I SAM-dependent methyltransferase [Paenibacillus sophorae]
MNVDDKRDDLRQILDYYNAGPEIKRLQSGIGAIEWERSKQIISRYLSDRPMVIYDIGGGAGAYSRWLAELGHEVHLFDLSPAAVEYAIALQSSGGIAPVHRIETADGRRIARSGGSADLILLMGPLYHLTERDERLDALEEAFRLLKPGGTLLAAAISRFGSTLWGLSVYGQKNDILEEQHFMSMIERELADGQHIRPEEYPNFIARAFFHLPNELKEEIEESGFYHLSTAAVEGPVWIVPALAEKWGNPESRAALLRISSIVEEQKSLLGMSPHLLAAAKKRI